MTIMRVAAVQLCSTADRDRNIARADALMAAAVRQGAQVIALPENWPFMGGPGEKLRMAESLESGPSVRFLADFAARHQVAVVGGSIPLATAEGSRVTNTCLAFDSAGRIVARYDKIHLFDVDIDAENTHRESDDVAPGDQVVTATLGGRTVGLSICYDLRFPELYRDLALRGAQVLFAPAAFTVPTGRDHWEVFLRARAIENQCYVVAPAQYGRHSPDRVTFGRSMIVGPWGQVMAQCQDGEGMIFGDLDFAYLEDVRRRLPNLQHIRHSLFFPARGSSQG